MGALDCSAMKDIAVKQDSFPFFKKYVHLECPTPVDVKKKKKIEGEKECLPEHTSQWNITFIDIRNNVGL